MTQRQHDRLQITLASTACLIAAACLWVWVDTVYAPVQAKHVEAVEQLEGEQK